jgi:hypothetical protein
MEEGADGTAPEPSLLTCGLPTKRRSLLRAIISDGSSFQHDGSGVASAFDFKARTGVWLAQVKRKSSLRSSTDAGDPHETNHEEPFQ